METFTIFHCDIPEVITANFSRTLMKHWTESLKYKFSQYDMHLEDDGQVRSNSRGSFSAVGGKSGL